MIRATKIGKIGRGRILCVIALLVWIAACHKQPVQPVVPAPPAAAPPEAPRTPPLPVPNEWPELPLPPPLLLAPPEPPVPRSFRDGKASFQKGKYDEAIRQLEKYVREDPTLQFKDEALFTLGMAHALACPQAECRTRAATQFRRLVSLFPKSPYSPEATFILSLQYEVEKTKTELKTTDEKLKRLTDELERLKKIDLERQPARIKK